MRLAILDFKIWAYARLFGFSEEMSRILVKIARLETAHYSSRGFLQENNPFGMGCVQSRDTTQTHCTPSADGVGIGSYRSVYSAVKDYAMWMRYWGLSQAQPSPAFWAKQNPKPTYEAAVSRVTDALGFGKAIAVVAFPLTYIAVNSALKLMK